MNTDVDAGTTTRMSAGWNFDNSYAALRELFFSHLNPKPVTAPELVVLNEALAQELGLDPDVLRSDDGVAIFAGNRVPEGSAPLAQAYAGHQFGGFTMLGDGRAILLGEQMTPAGERVDIQLKGSGRTPYSRGGDGRAALGPMLREYIISEAMHALGIPTTRSLAVVTTGEKIAREELLPGAILTRVAASHLRVGTFQYAAFVRGTTDDLRLLADYALERHFPEVNRAASADPDRFLQLLRHVMERQAALLAKWQLVGFIHGVMNTDNMAISGETIDYGPCAFMDVYDPATVFSSIDRQGRYAYGNQPRIALWNLARFAEALLPLLHDEEKQAIALAEETLAEFSGLYRRHWLAGMRAKLGLHNEEADDAELVDELLRMMETHVADYTNTFRALTLGRADWADRTPSLNGTDRPESGPNRLEGSHELNEASMFGTDEWSKWYDRWQARLDRQPQSQDEARELMRKTNPAVIPRNHRVEEALAAAVDEGDLTVMKRLLDVLADPFAYSPEQDDYSTSPQPQGRPYVTFCGT